MTTKRRKYKFADRETAEAEEARQRLNADALLLGLNAVLNGEVVWLPKWYGSRKGSQYHFGYVHRSNGSYVLVRHRCCHTSQKDYTICAFETWLDDQIDAYRRVPPADAEARSYRDGLCCLREAIFSSYKEWCDAN